MATRVKIKSKVVKDTLRDPDVLEMFHGVLGTSEGGATLSIIHPKYERIRTHVGRFLRILDLLRDSDVMRFFPDMRDHLVGYAAALRAQYDAAFCAPDLGPYVGVSADVRAESGAARSIEMVSAEGYQRVPPAVAAQFSAAFAGVKSCTPVNVAIVTCKNLVNFKKSLATAGALRSKFLRGAGSVVAPLPDLSQLNFKQVFIDDRLDEAGREYVLVILHKLYTIGHEVYEAVSAPDIDVNEFVAVVMNSIGEVRKHIPRCDDAFDKIAESVDLLRSNFDGYYKDYVASSNPTIIMENFVLDVSKTTKSSAKITHQFGTIIKHYRKIAAQKATSPQLAGLFQQVDKNFQELERRNKEADAADDSSSSDDDAVAAADDAGTAADDAGAAADDAGAAADNAGTARSVAPSPFAAAAPLAPATSVASPTAAVLSTTAAAVAPAMPAAPRGNKAQRRREKRKLARDAGAARGAAPPPQGGLADDPDLDIPDADADVAAPGD